MEEVGKEEREGRKRREEGEMEEWKGGTGEESWEVGRVDE